MHKGKSRDYILMHFIIFIWGFTAILGALISLNFLSLTWFRLLIALLFLGAWIWIKYGFKERFTSYDYKQFALNGFLIGVHWLLFFAAIKTGGVSVTLVALSSGAFFTAFLEPLFFKRKILWYEFFFGFLVILIMYYVFRVNQVNGLAVLLGMGAAFFGSLFSVLNGRLVRIYHAGYLSFFELLFAWVLLGILLIFFGRPDEILRVSATDLFWLIVLGSICTAYAFTASLEILRNINPFTLILSINLEPVYGIILAVLIFGEKEHMSFQFYAGAVMILILVVLEGIIKLSLDKKRA